MSQQAKPTAQVSKLLRANDTKVLPVDAWQAPDLTELKIKEAEASLQRYLAQARKDLAQELLVLREADRQLAFEQGRQQGLTKGYDEGYALGLKEAQAIADQTAAEWSQEKLVLRTEWEDLFTQIAQVFDVLDVEFFDQFIWLSQEVAKRLLRAELLLHPEHIKRIVGDALAELPKLVYPVSIYLNSEDIVLVNQLSFEQDKKIHILPDDQLARGECRVVSGHSELWHNWKLLSEQVMDQMVSQFVQTQSQAQKAEEALVQQQNEGVAGHENE